MGEHHTDYPARYRAVSEQKGKEYISTVVITEEEALETLESEEYMHDQTGWTVSIIGDPDSIDRKVVVEKGPHRRVISIRKFTPFNDIQAGGE